MSLPPRKLIDMPIPILEKILDDLTLVDLLRFRICSKFFKAVVDGAKPSYEKIGINSDKTGFTLTIVENGVEHCIKYNWVRAGRRSRCEVIVEKKVLGPANVYGPRQQIASPIRTQLKNGSAVDIFKTDVTFLFCNFKQITIDKLLLERDVCFNYQNYMIKFDTMANRNGQKLSVKELSMTGQINPKDVENVLSTLLPGFLHRMHFFMASGSQFHVADICQTQQWLQAKAVQITPSTMLVTYERHLTRFKFVELHCAKGIRTIQAAIAKADELGDQFEFLRLGGFGYGTLERRYIEENYPSLCDNPRFRYKQHPHLNSFLRIKVDARWYDVEIRRVQRDDAGNFEVTDNDQRYLDM